MLEFRMLELEGRESRERTPELVRKVETGTETEDVVSLHSFLGDSGCSSQTSFDDLREVQRDFRNEKIGDTQAALQALMEQIPEPGGRALLLQTVALFETLLAKIQTLQKEGKTLEQERDQLTLALEAKKSVEAKLEATETKLMSANEEVMNMIIIKIITITYQVEETLSKLFTAERRLQEEKAEGEKRESTARQVKSKSDPDADRGE